MVDPDNRRPVDFKVRRDALGEVQTDGEFMSDWRSGVVKQHLIRSLLELRAEYPALFAEGSYEPLSSDDPTLCAFLRRHAGLTLFVAVHLAPWRKVLGDDLVAHLPADLIDRPRRGLTINAMFGTLPAQVFLIR